MKNKLKFSLLLMILMLIPTSVFAASIDIGSAKTEDGKTSWPVIFKGDKLISSDVFSLDYYGNDNSMVNCAITYSSPLASTGAVGSDTEVPSSGLTVGTLTCQTTSTENQKGSVGIRGTLKTSAGTTDLNMNLKSYTVNAMRKKSSDSKFKTLTVSQGTMTPEFKSDTFEYTVYNLKDTIASVKISWTCDYCTVSTSNARATKNGSTTITYGIEKGNNDIEIEVQSEDGKNKDTYKITVIRGETEYNSAKVSSLTFGDNKLTPEFKEDTYEGYKVSVPYDVKDISKIASVVLKDPEATYEFTNGDNLTVGDNEVELTITSVLKDNTQVYKITVTRLNSENIKLLNYKDGQVKFVDADKAEQTLSEEEFKAKYPTVWKDIQDGKYKFDNDGNVVEDNTGKKKDNKVVLIIVIVIIGIIIIGISGYFIFRKKDPEKEKKKQEEKIKKKAMKKARQDELRKLEEEYYKEYYNEDYDDEEYEEESEEETEDAPEEEEEEIPKRSSKKQPSLLEDDYLFEQELIEEEHEEEEEHPKKKSKEEVVDVDTALEDLMNTKTYDFSDEFEDIDK